MSELSIKYADRDHRVVDALFWIDEEHLPPHLAAIVHPFAVLADELAETLGDGIQLIAAMRWLVLAKDAAVRQRIADLESEK